MIDLAAFAAALALSWAATGAVTAWLRRRAVLDQPNERSSHTVPTPRGGGLGVMAAVLPLWALLGSGPAWAALLAVPLAVVSWLDDTRGLPPAPRFLVQLAMVGAGLALLPDGPVLQGLAPLWLDRVFALLAWVWFVNLFNFMDGIDGITGVETAAIGAGLAAIAPLTGGNAAPAAVLAGAALGFLRWNWAPARVFLGDVGSVPLGFLLGWLLLSAAARGQWAPALILPAYYLADATLTLTRRVLRGEKPWTPHREHFYQKAARAAGGHAAVAATVLVADALLVGLAVIALARPWAAVVAAALLVGGLLARLTRLARTRPLAGP